MAKDIKIYSLTANGDLDLGYVDGVFSVKIRYESGSGTISVQGSDDGTNYDEFSENGSYTVTDSFILTYTGYLRFNLSSASSADIKISVSPVTQSY